ncbi:MAG: hypothetical protein H0W67_08990, partial [Gemmatimonadales bacterium]|nr:hypothetical protein [Gemmatimonadales bacterium]
MEIRRMTYTFKLSKRIAMARCAAPLLLALGACNGADQFSPSDDAPASASPATEAPSAETAPSFVTGATAPGVVFAAFDMENSLLGSVYTGSVRQPSPSSILSLLQGARSKGGRVFVKLAPRSLCQNSDGSFSLTKWKAAVDRFKSVDLAPYITDGTIQAHFLIDEPNDASNFGGTAIPRATLDAMAAYSKQRWPGMTTIVRVIPTW